MAFSSGFLDRVLFRIPFNNIVSKCGHDCEFSDRCLYYEGEFTWRKIMILTTRTCVRFGQSLVDMFFHLLERVFIVVEWKVLLENILFLMRSLVI